MLSSLLAFFVGLSRLLLLVSHVGFMRCSGKTLLRDVTGKALLCSAVVEFVAP